MNENRAYIAYTAQPNSPETDLQPMVMHVVEMTDGTQTKIMATDPMDAIKRVNDQLGV